MCHRQNVRSATLTLCHHHIYIKIYCVCVYVYETLYDKHTYKVPICGTFFFAYLAMRFRVLFGHGLILYIKKYLRLLWPNFRLI